ncbi:hypothetical protein GCM10011521_25630 [Arenimonas soli]|uniref:DUF4426 domain-containing protein n=1 Tax=Arenimonas soli TaxID=2269504 RepID=A0ABQ1HQA5_9GAMM|nr:DUF4426 domain-containing protein [Arenimonas soli]GGA86014.1 hypothetical protein GCM10011521_25630 [Arenimonas soli]
MRLRSWLAVALLFTLSLPAAANSKRVGDLRVYFNALPTTELTPEVARQYGITRSANRALLNVSVRRGEPGADVAVPAKVLAVATNLAGQRNGVSLREVRDGEALYYLGNVPINGQDTLTFEIEVIVQGQAPIKASFRQEFFPQ